VLGIVATTVRSGLKILNSLYLLFSIGLKGGQGLAHGPCSNGCTWPLKQLASSCLLFRMRLLTCVPRSA
jgi:hypothetical protein